MTRTRDFSDEEKNRRRRAVTESLAIVMQDTSGTGPSSDVLELMERYVSGQITLSELGSLVRAKYGIKE